MNWYCVLLVPGRFKAFQVKSSVEEEATEAHTTEEADAEIDLKYDPIF